MKCLDFDEEFYRRLDEPDHIKNLRRQRERLEREKAEVAKRILQELEADSLRRQIREFGEEPVA